MALASPAISKTGPFPILTGPTGVGKTALSLSIAERLGAEIISADSRQIYRELTIGAAKPGPDILASIRHHFINELSLGEPYSAGAFAAQVNARIPEILARGRVPFIVGGSTLYLHALQFGLAPAPPSDPQARHLLEERLSKEGADALYGELQRVDPASAATLDATKTSRLVRALEVVHSTGCPLSEYHARQDPPPNSFAVTVLSKDREILYRRIGERVDVMLEEGLLQEVRSILEAGFDSSLQALRTIGYQEPMAFIGGDISFDEMVRLIKRNSRRYAKRQLTWFRRYPGYRWADAKDLEGHSFDLPLSAD